MKLTPLAKAFVALVVLGVLGIHRLSLLWRRNQRLVEGAGATKADSARQGRRQRASPRTTSTTSARRPIPIATRASRGVTVGQHRRRQARPHAGRRHQHLGRPHAGHRRPTAASIRRRSSHLQDQVRPRREVRAHRGSGGEADRVHQGRHRRHVGHRRLVGARGVDAGRAEHPGQGDHPAGLVARRRRHRRRSRRINSDRGSEGQDDRDHAVHAVALAAAVSALAVGPQRRRQEGDREEPGVHRPRRRSRPPRSRPRRSTPR